ncbi:ATPase component of ABC-type sugar transporter [Xenococcus sp. PCC 7305]|uniref:ABC transporter ATP-binding protein n=1 Tax=Xenococcus sp. PCC 7305 TaxID=102125 RepID=UPI0002ACD5D0|nr:ABC transporter ATP-binding protein [Xenococcus sp. PCC 7305]ELS00609.1 ATPase component of ABC-type sugar transporter [Xenococcus sp. PCC 7305]
MAKVVFENVYKSFPRRLLDSKEQGANSDQSSEVNILRNIDLKVDDGEFMVLVGPSGCGKSTLLRLLAGLEKLTAGNISIGDRVVNQTVPKSRDIAMVFQNYALYPHLNVYDNIAFGLRRNQLTVNSDPHSRTSQLSVKMLMTNALAGLTRALPRRLCYKSEKEREIEKQVKSVAELLQIEALLDRLPKELSGGQKQRVALGRAIARNPQVFLMDEPLSNLDAKLRTETRGQIVQLQKQLGVTTIYVTHDQTEAMTMGDRIAVMNQGKIQQIAQPLEIYNQPANLFVAEFIGSPPMNFLSVDLVAPLTLKHDQFTLNLPDTWQAYLADYQHKSLILGVRPQYFALSIPSKENLAITVDLVEALGNETYISAHLTQQPKVKIIASIPPDKIIFTGESLFLAIASEKIHLFDPETGESIGKINGLRP